VWSEFGVSIQYSRGEQLIFVYSVLLSGSVEERPDVQRPDRPFRAARRGEGRADVSQQAKSGGESARVPTGDGVSSPELP